MADPTPEPRDTAADVASAPPGLKGSVRKAERIGRDKGRLRTLLGEAAQKAAKSKDRLGEAWQELQTLVRLLRAWVSGKYAGVPWRVIVLGIAAVLYFVNPFDLIPDFLGFGLLDDIGAIAYAASMMRADLDRFRAWERGEAIDVPGRAVPAGDAEA